MILNKRIYLYTSIALLFTLIPFTWSYDDGYVEDEEESNPLLDLASNFIQSSLSGNGGNNAGGMAALGGIIGGLMQGGGGGGKNIGDAIMGMQGGNTGGAADVISSLGTLFTNKDGELDPNLIGSVISAFADSVSKNNNDERQQEKPVKKREVKQEQGQMKKRQQKQAQEPAFDMGTILNVASAFLANQNQNQNARSSSQSDNMMENIMGALPLIMNTLSAFNGPEADARAHKHSDHAGFLPPVIEKLHVYWDHFINSDLGKTVWENAGLADLTKTFVDKNGNVDFEIILKSLENHSFRRKWIKRATHYLTEWAVHMANPEVQHRYLSTSQFVVNNFLKSQGFPKNVVFQPAQFTDSVSNIINYVLKKYVNVPTDVSIYVRPAVKYLNDILKSAETHGSFLRSVNKNELSDKLTDTLNLEIIEPILKVYRAYRFARKAPQCQTHILCVINRHDPNEKLGLPGFKAGLTKLSSLAASAALSYHGGHGFWDLYNAVQEESNCQARYPAECDDFHDEEIKVTTEYYHNEL